MENTWSWELNHFTEIIKEGQSKSIHIKALAPATPAPQPSTQIEIFLFLFFGDKKEETRKKANVVKIAKEIIIRGHYRI